MLKIYALPLLVIFASSFLIRVNHSANVLCMFTSSGKSQLIVFLAVANTLIERDHNVTVVTTIPIPPQLASKKPFRHILLTQPKDSMKKLNDNISQMVDDMTSKVKAMISFVTVVNMFTTIQRDAVKQEQFQRFLQEDNHFDLMLLGYFNNDFLVGVAARYGCPIAVISLGPPYGPISRMVGNPEETTYVQFPLFGKNQPMTFMERLTNFLWAAVEPCIHAYANWMMEGFYTNLFPAEFYPKYSDVIANISLVLTNNHFSELPVRPLVPALIEIGGIQFQDPPDPFPEDIQTFLDSSASGSILYSVGSKIRGCPLKPEKLQIILDVLSKLDQKIIWEWALDEEPPTIYPNILFKRSLIHEDILSHRSMILYMTDGRPNTVFGAQYRGIPMLGIPLCLDEIIYLEDMKNKGFGIFIEEGDLTETSLKEGLSEVLENPYYKQNIKQFSNIYRDRPTTARETAAFWLEYVIRHRGAHHMQSPLVHLDFVQRWNIDVILVLLASVYAFIKMTKLFVLLVRTSIEIKEEMRNERCTKYKRF